MIPDIIKAVIGLVLATALPGYLITVLVFQDLKILEQIGYSFLFSIFVDVLIAIFFGYDLARMTATGGITFTNLLAADLVVIGSLALIVLLRDFIYIRKHAKKRKTRKQKDK